MTIPVNPDYDDDIDGPSLSSEDGVKKQDFSRQLMEKVMASSHPHDRRLFTMLVPSVSAKAETYDEKKAKLLS